MTCCRVGNGTFRGGGGFLVINGGDVRGAAAGTLLAVGALFLVGGGSDVRAEPLPALPGGVFLVISGGGVR
jgi:hypothetical protein